jgi:hypothetical protein
MRKVLDWHRQQAEMLAKQLPRDVDDAIIVVDCLAQLLENAAQSPDDLPECRLDHA